MSREGPFRYHAHVLEHLERHGIQPGPHTRPDLVRDFVRELYKYEIRRLRDRVRGNEFPREEYAARVDTLRRRYRVLALSPAQFVE